MEKVNKIFWIVIASCIGLIILIASLGSNEKSNYDTSMMNEVDVKDILQMFESKKTYVLFVGRKNCIVCEKIIPILEEAQKKNNYITQYIDMEKIDRSSEDWDSLVKKLTMKSTQTVTEDGSGEKITETYGYFLHNYGFTPTVIVIKDGKQTGGLIGGADKEEFLAWIANKVA